MGTPCNAENFKAWKEKFDAEMRQATAGKNGDASDASATAGKGKGKDTVGVRVTGYDYFVNKSKAGFIGILQQEGEEGVAVDEELFMDDLDDDDLDGMDFDDDDDDDDDGDGDGEGEGGGGGGGGGGGKDTAS